MENFVTRPDLKPPRVTVTHAVGGPLATTAPGPLTEGAPTKRWVLVSPKGYQTTGPGQPGLMMFDERGRLGWFLPSVASDAAPFDLQVQTYKGQPVLTWWQGTSADGYGQGTGILYDTSYRPITRIEAGNGLKVDLHELNLTPQGSALITAYRKTTADLSSVGGSSNGPVLACQAQEIDVSTGKMLFSWDSLDHVPVTDSYTKLGSGSAPFDYFHINSVALASDGNLLISSRNTWTVYKVDRSTGTVMWRLGGKHSDFAMGPGTRFYWQHHVRQHPNGVLSIFDDGASPPEETQSRAILVHLDNDAKQATLVRQYEHPARLLAANQGSVQVLSDNSVFVGWGDQPYFSQFEPDGTLIFDGRFPADDQSYRAFNFPWSGRPTDDPAVVARTATTGDVTLYVSWNGATEVEAWQVLAGTHPASMTAVAKATRTGFETTISVGTDTAYYQVAALNHKGAQIGRSQPVKHPR